MTWSFWVVTAAVFFIIEILTPGVFFFACLGVGALVAGIMAFFAVPVWLTWLIFAAASVVSIYFVRPFATRLLRVKSTRTNVDALIGKTAQVIEDIVPPDGGLVKAGGEIWRARASERIDKGALVTVTAVSGVHLTVTR